MSKKVLMKYFIIIMYGIFGSIAMILSKNLYVSLVIIWLLALISVVMVKFDIFHPYTWFSILFSLYNTAYAISYIMGYHDILGCTYQSILYPFISLVIVLIIVGPNKIKIKEKINNNREKGNINFKFVKNFLIIISVCVFIISLVLFLKGYSGKNEMKAANDIFYKIGVYAARYCAMFMIIFLNFGMNEPETKIYKISFFAISSTIMFSLVTGERDAMFRSIASFLLVLFSYNKLKKKHLIIAIPAFMGIMIVSVAFKYYMSTGTINYNFLKPNDFVYQFLATDFISTGSNFQKLLNNPWTKGYMGYKLLMSESLGFFLPSSLTMNPDHWFNYEVYTGQYHGRAFTLMGTGYIISGLVGIIIISIMLAFIIKFLYNKSTKNIYSISIYIYMITTIVFSFRQSFSTIPIALFRIALISTFICIIFSRKNIQVETDEK